MTITRITPVRSQEAPEQAVRLIQILMEALAGRRALHQVRPVLLPAAFVRLADYADSGQFRHLAIGPIRTQMPTPRAVEATVPLLCGSRVVSCVIRLDVHGQRWRCTELAVLRPAALLAAAA